MILDLIMIDECGDEAKVDSYKIGKDLDEDYIELWKCQKIEQAQERFSEARGFYFERPFSDMSYGELELLAYIYIKSRITPFKALNQRICKYVCALY